MFEDLTQQLLPITASKEITAIGARLKGVEGELQLFSIVIQEFMYQNKAVVQQLMLSAVERDRHLLQSQPRQLP